MQNGELHWCLVLTFNEPKVPDTIDAAYLYLWVHHFLPIPMCCNKCQQFGHGQNSCSHNPACESCRRTYHSLKRCQSGPHCITWHALNHSHQGIAQIAESMLDPEGLGPAFFCLSRGHGEMWLPLGQSPLGSHMLQLLLPQMSLLHPSLQGQCRPTRYHTSLHFLSCPMDIM